MVDAEKIKSIIAQGEGWNIEFKKSRDSLSRSLFETVCAFLNRQGEVDIKLLTYIQKTNLYIRKQPGYTENRVYPRLKLSDFVDEDFDRERRLYACRRTGFRDNRYFA